MEDNSKVSIVIPVYNGSNYLKQAIDSAINQTYKNIEIIVVNDGSNDDEATEKIALSYGDKIKYYKKVNGGVASALNLALKNMTGKYFSWLSHDDLYYANKIEKQINFINEKGLENKNVILFSNYDLIDSENKLITKCEKNHQELENKEEYALLRGHVNGITMLIPKKAFDEFGFFDETLKCTQDYDMWKKMMKKYKFIHQEEILASTRIHSKRDTEINPNVALEGNKLWIQLIEDVSDERKKELEGSIYNYYREMSFFLESTPYKEAKKYCDNKKDPKVTILIPVYNGANYIKYAIDSAINQTYKNIEILVINDGSTDNGATEKIVKSFADKVKYVYKVNGGVASALNFGIKMATGEYISWLSHDDIYMPNKIEKEIRELEKIENRNTIIFSNFELIDENGITFSKTNFTKNIEITKFCQGIYPVLKGCVNGCTILIPKECFENVGYFKENLKTTNDYEMWVRLFDKYPSRFIEDYLIKYRIHENQDTNKNPFYISESNELWSNIINSLSEDIIKRWGFDVFNTYMTLYIQMKNSKFNVAAELAYKKANEIYKKIVPNVTIAMPCYNSIKYLSKSIQSILEQTYCNFEFIIVNDSSTDNTLIELNKFAKKDFRIKVLQNEFNKGVSGAMNTALKHAQGKYFTRMDSDDISILDRIEKQVNFLENNSQYGICSVNISMMDEMNNIYNEGVYPDSNIPHEWTFLWTNPIPNAPIMYLFEIIKNNNILFSDIKTAEDYEFLSKIILKTRAYMIPEPLYIYRHMSSSLFNSNLKETFENSLKISKNYLKQITNLEIPEYYNNLTFFELEDSIVFQADIKVVNKYLIELANILKQYFNWSEIDYNDIMYSIPDILERYIIKKAGLKRKIEINNIKISKGSKVKRLLKKVKNYYNKFGFKKTLKTIFKKIKEKIWTKK